MQAKLENHGEITVVELSGRVDLECIESFRKACKSHFMGKKIVFDLRHLSFVGSTGITPFLQTFEEMQQGQELPRFVGLSSEFRRLFAACSLRSAKVYSDRTLAFNSFYFEPHDPGFL